MDDITKINNNANLSRYLDRIQDTVSYTHLDVYKRQGLARAPLLEGIA